MKEKKKLILADGKERERTVDDSPATALEHMCNQVQEKRKHRCSSVCMYVGRD